MKLKYSEINGKINEIRKIGIKFSNVMLKPNVDENFVFDVLISDRSILFWYKDNGILRGFFTSSDEKDLSDLIRICPEKLIFEYSSRKKDELSSFFSICGCKKIVTQVRISVSDVRPFLESEPLKNLFDENYIQYAKKENVSSINEMLHRTFDSRVSHFISDEEMVKEIEQKNILANDDSTAILQIKEEGVKLYINQIVNKTGNKKIIHSMLQYVIKQFVSTGKKYVYAWVDEDNIASLKFHSKYGLKHDGMYSDVWECN